MVPVRLPTLVVLAAFLVLDACVSDQPDSAQLRNVSEASGIVRNGNELLIVDDSDPGAYYRYPIDATGPSVPIEPSRLVRVQWPEIGLAADLESIDVLADGRIVLLSERLRSLVDEHGVVMEYDDPLTEIGERGLEGLAI